MNNNQKRYWFGFASGSLCGLFAGASVGGFLIFLILGAAFVDYAHLHPTMCQSVANQNLIQHK